MHGYTFCLCFSSCLVACGERCEQLANEEHTMTRQSKLLADDHGLYLSVSLSDTSKIDVR